MHFRTFQNLVACLCLLIANTKYIHAQIIPDFTNGDQIPEAETAQWADWNLGATGARGWVYSPIPGESVRTDARQIYVTSIAPGSPASNKLQVGDVILGTDRSLFTSDPRVALAKAITTAESNQGNGNLLLRIWRAGTTSDINLQLLVTGNYSDTAPFNCNKSEFIVNRAISNLTSRMQSADYAPKAVPRTLNALALLSTGNPIHHNLVREQVIWGIQKANNERRTWIFAYVLILMSEYTLATGNNEFIPEIRNLALKIANIQSPVGSWGHRGIRSNGLLGGYGMINATGIPLNIALILARKTGVNDPVITDAINKKANLIRFHSGKGAIPYGDHSSLEEYHEDNGKNSIASIMFDLLGETQHATYFSKSALASHNGERERGHTGNFFNILWSLMSISKNGADASGLWMKEYGSWYFDLARTWDGSFIHQRGFNKSLESYRGWDATGAFILNYNTRLKKIFITGKQPSQVINISRQSAEQIIDDGRGLTNTNQDINHYKDMSDDRLYQKLSSWSPTVRLRASKELVSRKPLPEQRLIHSLSSTSLNTKLGACQALTLYKDKAIIALPTLRQLLSANDLWLRVKAATAIAAIGPAAQIAAEDILLNFTKNTTSEDPRKMEQRFYIFILFDTNNGLLKDALHTINSQTLVKVINQSLKNDDGFARQFIGNLYSQLGSDLVKIIMRNIYDASKTSAPSGIMFADNVRINGLQILQQFRVKQGLEAAMEYLKNQNQWKSELRTEQILEIIESYGIHAKSKIPELNNIANYFDTEPDFPETLRKIKAASVRASIDRIQNNNQQMILLDLEGFPTVNLLDEIITESTTSDSLNFLSNTIRNSNHPNTGIPWKLGDTYRVMFVTSELKDALSPNIENYNNFVSQLAASSAIPLIKDASWKALGSTSNINARDNTKTNPQINGKGCLIVLSDGSTILAQNNQDLWDSNLLNPINKDENGNSLPANANMNVFTGSSKDGTKSPFGQVLGNNTLSEPGHTFIQTGSASAKDKRWIYQFRFDDFSKQRFFALSAPIIISNQNSPTPLDRDKGGIPDTLEKALGGDHLNSSDDVLLQPKLTVKTNNNSKVTFTFSQLNESKRQVFTDLNVEYSNDFITWKTATHQGTANHQITFTTSTDFYGPGIDQVAVDFPESLSSASGKFFVRLKLNE